MKRYNGLYSMETLYIGGSLQRKMLIELDRYLEFVWGDSDFLERAKADRAKSSVERYIDFYLTLCEHIGVTSRETVKAWRAEEEGVLRCQVGICDRPARYHIYGRDGFTQVLCAPDAIDLLERFTHTENPSVEQMRATGLTFANID